MISENIFPNILCSYIERLEMVHYFRKFISEVFVNGKFPKILPSKNFPLYGSQTFSQKMPNVSLL